MTPPYILALIEGKIEDFKTTEAYHEGHEHVLILGKALKCAVEALDISERYMVDLKFPQIKDYNDPDYLQWQVTKNALTEVSAILRGGE